LRAVANTKDLHVIADNLVDRYVGPRRTYEFAGILHEPDSSAGRECAQPSNASNYGLGNAAGGGGIVFTDVLDDVSEIASGCGRPADAH